jgi:hypothetical protein
MSSIDSLSISSYHTADESISDYYTAPTTPQNAEPAPQEPRQSDSRGPSPLPSLPHTASGSPASMEGSTHLEEDTSDASASPKASVHAGASGQTSIRSVAVNQKDSHAAAHQAITATGVLVRGAGRGAAYENVAPKAQTSRNKLRKSPPAQKYKEIGMLESALVPDAISMHVPYLGRDQRENYRVSVANGLLKDRQGQPLDTGTKAHMIVMDKSGRIYAGPSETLRNHSSFLAGNPVAAAGMITLQNGKVTGLYNESGHYQVPQDYFDQLHTELKRKGVKVSPDALQQGKKYSTSKQIARMKKRNAGNAPEVDFSKSTKEPESIPVGTHKPGQRQRLYPTGPKWNWF